jgi:ABC-type transport system substrate-binding protein
VGLAAAATPTLTAAPEEQTFSFPWPPEWVAHGKYQKMILRGITGFNPGQWDVQACGTLPDCLMPSSPQFNGLVYHNPVNPDEIVCDLCDSWTVSADSKTYTFRLRQALWQDGHGQKNPDSWSQPRLSEIIEAQAREPDRLQRLALFKEAVAILRQGESHVVPLSWGYSGGLMDYRLQNFHVPGSEQIVKHFEHIWWDPEAPLPRD